MRRQLRSNRVRPSIYPNTQFLTPLPCKIIVFVSQYIQISVAKSYQFTSPKEMHSFFAHADPDITHPFLHTPVRHQVDPSESQACPKRAGSEHKSERQDGFKYDQFEAQVQTANRRSLNLCLNDVLIVFCCFMDLFCMIPARSRRVNSLWSDSGCAFVHSFLDIVRRQLRISHVDLDFHSARNAAISDSIIPLMCGRSDWHVVRIGS